MSKAVIFDMDGVLFDTERLYMDGLIVVADKLGLPNMKEAAYDCIGRNANDTRAVMLKAYGEDFDYKTVSSQASDWFHEQIALYGLPIKPGVKELLDDLKQQEYRIGLASSTRRTVVLEQLKQAQIADYFEQVIGGDMVEHSKPEPDIYLIACRELGVEPQEAYAIEDSPNGIRSAYRAGMKPIMVPDLLPADEEMEQLSTVILPDLHQVQAWLAEKENQ